MPQFRMEFEIPTFGIQAEPMIAYFRRHGYDVEFSPADDGLSGVLTVDKPLDERSRRALYSAPHARNITEVV